MLLRGIQLPQPLPEAQEPLQVAKRLRTEPEQPGEQHQYKLPESTAGQAKQRQTSVGRPPLRPKAPAQSQMLVTPSAPGSTLQMVPNILIPAAPGFQGVPMFQAVPMFQGIPMVQGVQMVQGMPMMQPLLQPTVVQGTSSHPATPAANPEAMPKRTVEVNTWAIQNKCNRT